MATASPTNRQGSRRDNEKSKLSAVRFGNMVQLHSDFTGRRLSRRDNTQTADMTSVAPQDPSSDGAADTTNLTSLRFTPHKRRITSEARMAELLIGSRNLMRSNGNVLPAVPIPTKTADGPTRPTASDGTQNSSPHNVANHNDDDDEDLEVYMLAESRRAYRTERPPFVHRYRASENPPGSRKVVVLANDGFRPRAAAKVRKAELVCRAYDANDGFWTLDQYEIRYIVKATGGGFLGGATYKIWWGPEKGFGEKGIAFSDHVVSDLSGQQDNDRQGQRLNKDYIDKHLDDGRRSPLSATDQQSSRRERHPREAKNKENSTKKVVSEGSAELERKLQERRDRRRLQRRLKHDPKGSMAPHASNPGKPRLSSIPVLPPQAPTMTAPAATPSSIVLPTKRERSPTSDLYGQSPEAIRHCPRQSSPNPSVVEVSQPAKAFIDRYKQSHTTLHISLSTNDYGAVPVYLRSCMTMETFFASALAAWGLEGKESEVAAVTVKFDWLKEEGPMVVRKEVVDSFQKVLETITEAPVWKDGGVERPGCDVRVKIIMK